ncbi:MAG: PAS domain S-box protein [Cellvibrionaceae bacterium]|nr:PAS domain S-box protein [Cellvibrionaceae bacterium]
MKTLQLSIQASLLASLVLLTGLLFLLSLFIWVAFDDVSTSQRRLIAQSLPTLRAIDTVVDHGLDLLEISAQLNQVLSEHGFHRLESRVTAALELIESDLVLLSSVGIPDADYEQLSANSIRLKNTILRALNLQRVVVNNNVSLIEERALIFSAVEAALIEIKLVYYDLAAPVSDFGMDSTANTQLASLIDLRFTLQRFEAVVDQLQLGGTQEAVIEVENQYRLLIHNLSSFLLDFTPKIRARLVPTLIFFNDNFIKEDNIFVLSRDRVELQASLASEQQKSLALNQAISALYQNISLAANSNVDADAQTILRLIASSRVALIATVLVFILIVFGTYLFFVRPKIIRRLLVLTKNTTDIAAGKFDVDISLKGADEISAMAAALGYFRDELVEKEKVQIALRDREARLSTIIDNAAEGLITINMLGVVLSVNPAAEKIFKGRADTLVGTNVVNYLPEAKAEFTTHRQQSTAGEGSGLLVCAGKSMSAWRVDGEAFSAKLSVSLINLSGVHIYSCFIRDVTLEKQAQQKIESLVEELTSSNDDLERFAYSCSHDLQEPVRMVISFGELLRQKSGDVLNEQCQGYLNHIIANGENAKSLIGGILAYSRLDRSTIKKQWVSVDELCRRVQSVLYGVINERQAEFIWAGGDMKVKAVQSQMLQLLLNLVSNGLKYNNSAQPRVVVAAKATTSHWVLAVTDNGIGIEARYFKKIFEVFTRLVSRRDYSGSGIGLSLCQKVVEKHGGTIYVTSTPDEGSCFEVRLPIID